MTVLIAPSILSADFGKLNEEVASIEAYADVLHVDVMDGHFVPNLSFGAPVFKWLKTEMPVHCHLMVTNPEDYVDVYAKSGCDLFTFHSEVVEDMPAFVQRIKDAGMQVGVSIKPNTSVSDLEAVIEDIDQVLVMSVEPGFGGQSFMPVSLDKICELRARRTDLQIGVDGGINNETAPQVIAAGADLLISGSYIFKAPDREAAIASLRP